MTTPEVTPLPFNFRNIMRDMAEAPSSIELANWWSAQLSAP